MPRVEVAGGSLNYEIAGHGESMLLIPGLSGVGSFWRAQIAAFSARFRTITFDHRGVGESTGMPPYSVDQWAEDVIALLDHVGVGSAHLVGHSTGGVIAQVVASKRPRRVTSVVLGGTWAQPDERFRRVFELRRDVLSALGTDAYAFLGSILIAPPDETLAATKPEPTDPANIEARIEVLLAYQGVGHLRRIRCPALVVAAADDVLIPVHLSRAVAAGIAGADLKILPQGGHSFPRSRPTDYNRIVLEFLSKNAPRPSAAQTARGEGVSL
jgi:aminoacrylate hydrolase